MLYYCSMELHYCKESPKKKKNVTQVQVQILCKSCASIFPCFTLFFQKLFRISHKKRSFSRFKPDFSRYFGYFPVPFGVGVVEAASSSLVTQTNEKALYYAGSRGINAFLVLSVKCDLVIIWSLRGKKQVSSVLLFRFCIGLRGWQNKSFKRFCGCSVRVLNCVNI